MTGVIFIISIFTYITSKLYFSFFFFILASNENLLGMVGTRRGVSKKSLKIPKG